jgi:hypothetical protein
MILRPRVVRLKCAMLKDKRIAFKKPIDQDREVSLSRSLKSTFKRYAAPLGAQRRASACRHLGISSK